MTVSNPPPRFPLANTAFGPAPLRRPESIRRTTTIDTSWPDGFGKPMIMTGRARDIKTDKDGNFSVLAQAAYEMTVSPTREILAIKVDGGDAEAQKLVGVRGGGQSRAALAEIFADERENGSPLFQILDDFAGASLVAGWAWSRWVDDFAELRTTRKVKSTAGRNGNMEGVCSGFAPGSSALLDMDTRAMQRQNCAAVPSLVNPKDPDGWHAMPEQEGVGMRRARRLDIWRDGARLMIDVGFQDSATAPDGEDRIAVHEYNVKAEAEDGVLTKLTVVPHILPFAECPGAVSHAQRIVGTPMVKLREQVLETLPGILGCTHLNDVMRAMADMPHLAELLE